MIGMSYTNKRKYGNEFLNPKSKKYKKRKSIEDGKYKNCNMQANAPNLYRATPMYNWNPVTYGSIFSKVWGDLKYMFGDKEMLLIILNLIQVILLLMFLFSI